MKVVGYLNFRLDDFWALVNAITKKQSNISCIQLSGIASMLGKSAAELSS